MAKHNFQFKVDLNVINHLGVGLYSSTPAALTELVANAWDADAKTVTINVNAAKRTITIEDNGHGMTALDIQEKFLNVGYSRRIQSTNKQLSKSKKRRVMGRKGIGKLAMFALADEIHVSSQAKGSQAVGFKIDVPAFKKSLQEHKTETLVEFVPKPFKNGQGTRIELKKVLSGLQTTESFLRVRLARRFSVIDDARGFEVVLNTKKITKQDRGFYQHVQFLWAFDTNSASEVQRLAPNIAKLPRNPKPRQKQEPCVTLIDAQVSHEPTPFEVTGYIASVAQPSQLGAKEDSANMLSIFANGRVFAENVLSEANSAKYYQNYLVGEIHADFLDDDLVDRATASREAIKKDDPKYQVLLRFVRSTLDNIGEQWDTWRTDLGLDEQDPQNETVIEWLDTLDDPRDKRAATRLMTSIKNARIHVDEAKNEAARRTLYRGAIVGFEKLRITKELDRLQNISDVLSPEFAGIFAGLEQVEETAYADITRQRLAVIKKFADIANDPSTLEKVAQKYLFNHLWLLDPGWDRVTGRAEMEKTLTNHLKRIPDANGARLDITYRASSGRHVVVELKKPSKTNLKSGDLHAQINKYRMAVQSYYKDREPNKPVPPLDIYLLVGKRPVEFDDAFRNSLAAIDGKLITYTEIITNAKNAYQQYLSVAAHVGPLESILQRL